MTPGKSRKRTRRKGKVGSRPIGAVEEQIRVERREKEYADTLSRLDMLGDPYDDMSIEEKKRHALFLFYDKIRVRIVLFVCLTDGLRPVTFIEQCLIVQFVGWVGPPQ